MLPKREISPLTPASRSHTSCSWKISVSSCQCPYPLFTPAWSRKDCNISQAKVYILHNVESVITYVLVIYLLLINDLKFILSAAIPSFYSHQAGNKKIASPTSQLDILYSQNLGCIRLQDVDAGGFVKPHSHTLVSIGKSCISNSHPCQERSTKLASNGSVVTKPTKRYDLRTDYNEAGSWLGLELVQEENEIHYQHSSHHSLHLCQAPHFPQTLLA